MKILAVSDLVVEQLYSAGISQRFADVSLILGCGDLPYDYLEFLVSTVNKPLLYIPGNHDPKFQAKQPATFAEGCTWLDQRVMQIKGLSIAGMGGSMRYRPGRPNQYSEKEMALRLLPLVGRLALFLARHSGRLDIMIAHSPPCGVHDDNDLAHTGFKVFMDFIHLFKPRFFLHGHVMVYKSNLVPPVTRIGDTTVVNVYPYRLIEVETL